MFLILRTRHLLIFNFLVETELSYVSLNISVVNFRNKMRSSLALAMKEIIIEMGIWSVDTGYFHSNRPFPLLVTHFTI